MSERNGRFGDKQDPVRTDLRSYPAVVVHIPAVFGPDAEDQFELSDDIKYRDCVFYCVPVLYSLFNGVF